MSITEISFGRTIQIEDYESAKINLTASLAPGEDWRKALAQLKAAVLAEERAIRKAGTPAERRRKPLKISNFGFSEDERPF